MNYLKTIGTGVIIALVLILFLFVKGPQQHDHEGHNHSQNDQSQYNHEDHEQDEYDHGEQGHDENDQGDHEHENHNNSEQNLTDLDNENQEVEETGTENHTDHDHEELISVDGEWESMIGLATGKVIRMTMDREILVPGKIIPDPDQKAVISPFIESSVNCVFVNVGDRVKAGDELICLTSPEIGMLRAEFDRAGAELEIKLQNYNRKKKLYDEKVISERVFQEAELEKRIAEVNLNYAKKKMLAIGITENELENPPTGHSDAVGSTIHVHTPISGIVIFRSASIGQKVDPSSQLIEIVNIQNVWLEADIFEKDISYVKSGQTVKVRVSAYPEEVFFGSIFHVGNTLNPQTKTIKVLVEIENMDEKLKPGMFADSRIVVGEKTNALAINREAVLEDENLEIVFVKEEGGYHRHVVKTGIVSDPYIEILNGLDPGDVIVTRGNYQLKSKLKMSSVDTHAGHIH